MQHLICLSVYCTSVGRFTSFTDSSNEGQAAQQHRLVLAAGTPPGLCSDRNSSPKSALQRHTAQRRQLRLPWARSSAAWRRPRRRSSLTSALHASACGALITTGLQQCKSNSAARCSATRLRADFCARHVCRAEPGRDYAIDLQQTRRQAERNGFTLSPLFQFVSPDVFRRPTFQLFVALLDNYKRAHLCTRHSIRRRTS